MTDNKEQPKEDVEKFLEKHQQQNMQQEIATETKESHLDIKINKWGFTFMIIFIAIVAYLIISPLVGIVPFEYGGSPGTYEINDLVITILGVVALVSLGLGIYFGWIRKDPEEESKESTDEIDETEPRKDSTGQITFVYKEDEND